MDADEQVIDDGDLQLPRLRITHPETITWPEANATFQYLLSLRFSHADLDRILSLSESEDDAVKIAEFIRARRLGVDA